MDQFVDDFHEQARVDGLGEVRGGTGFEPSLDVTIDGVGANDDDGNRASSRIVAKSLQYFVAVDVGQAHVQQHNRRLVIAGHFEATEALCRGDELEVGPTRKNSLDKADVGDVVL